MTSPAYRIARLLLLGVTGAIKEPGQERGKVEPDTGSQLTEQLHEMKSPPPPSEEDRADAARMEV